MKSAYREDLAYIHDAGFGHLARAAAPVLLDALAQAGLRRGRIAELGCGSGISTRMLCDAGYSVVGWELSGPLIEIARRRVPKAELFASSFVDAPLPDCVAVTAIGEVLGYAFDPANDGATRQRIFERVHRALSSGGVFLFDMAGPERAPAAGRARSFVEGPDCAVLVEVESDASRTLLTRRITSFRSQGDLFRRDVEVHRLMLVDPSEIVESLERLGFVVRMLDRYGTEPLPPGLVAFLARKP